MSKQEVGHRLSRELEPLECDHEWETYGKDGCELFQQCIVCDKTRVIETEDGQDRVI